MVNGREMLDRLKSNKTKDGNKIILENTKGTLTGSAIGLFVGLYIGKTRDYPLLISGVLGALAGGLVSKFFINKN
jgi:outer membrane lipoprotein SlyB